MCIFASMTKQEYIEYWKTTSTDDWKCSEDLFLTKHYLQALFFAHLSIEKLCKAIWVKQNENNHPPRIHNLVSILKQTSVEIPEQQLDFLLLFNDFNLEGRYPDYLGRIFKMINQDSTKLFLSQANENKQWLLSKLQ